MEKLWKKFDLGQELPIHLDKESQETCMYAREYVSEGYKLSYDNQFIFNFKKPVDKKGKPEWRYKERACEQFANDLHNLFKNFNLEHITFVTIPTSKLNSHDQFDPRFEMMNEQLLKLGNTPETPQRYCYESPIIIKQSVPPAHEGGSRNIDERYNNYQWDGFQNSEPKTLFIVDDVITTGCQFMAYKKLLLEKCPTLQIYGIFCAKARRKNAQEAFEII